MKLNFPNNFFWGTSTAAAQIETASAHNWRDVKANDGYIFNRTTDHELQRATDVQLIKQFGTVYRCGVDWARLQPTAGANFDLKVVKEYLIFFEQLQAEGMKIMFVFHHFTNPIWFEKKGAFEKTENIKDFIDYSKKCIQHFGKYVFSWNTFNEPNVYTLNGYLMGEFPPFKKNYFLANRVIGNMSKAHNILYDILKKYNSEIPVGISHNTIYTKGINLLGKIFANFLDWWFISRTAELFKKVDYWGISYYAFIPFKPTPITEIANPGKLAKMGLPHDKMWAYYPEGFGIIMRRLYKKYKLPFVITENGVCSEDSDVRIQSIKDYLKVIHDLLEEGVPVLGYIHWSTWDNFEWNLGRTYRFGLMRTDFNTMERKMTKAAEFYKKLTKENSVDLGN